MSDAGELVPPEAVVPPAELSAEYFRADDELLVDSIELAEPGEPTNTFET